MVREPNLTLRIFTLLGVLLFLFAAPAHARNLHGRLGVGFNNQFANYKALNSAPGFSLKYAMTRDVAVQLIVGLSTGTPTNSVTAIKLYKNVFFENHMNFYFQLGGGLVNGNTYSGAELMTALGAEFFIPGVESVGFMFEAGVGMNNLNDTSSFVISTLGASFLEAGMHFYF